MITYRKMIVMVAEKEGETKDDAAMRLCDVIKNSNSDLEVIIRPTDERETAVEFQMSGTGIQGILDVIDAS